MEENNENNQMHVEYHVSKKSGGAKNIIMYVVIAVVVAVISSLLTYTLVSKGNGEAQTITGSNNTTYNVENVENPVVAVAQIAGPSVVGVKVDSYAQSIFGGVEEESDEGSGIIYSQDGYIITNYHVIESAAGQSNAAVTVTLNTGDEYEATIVGYDSVTDLALLKIDAKDLKAATFGNSDELQVGELAVAIGNPLGQELAGSVTVGYVSALNRTITADGRTYKLIQTDAAINPGNSGGALVNSKGEVIGINTVKISDEDVEGIGFSIPINDALKIIEELKTTGKIVRPYIGIYGVDIDEVTAARNKLVEGVYVYQVLSNSPASAAGVQRGDIIVEFDGKSVTTKQELNDAKNEKAIGDKVKVKVFRNGDYKELELTLTGDDSSDGNLTN